MRSPDLGAGITYEHTYGGWLRFFRNCAEEPGLLSKVPLAWGPFLAYLGCTVHSTIQHFVEDAYAPRDTDIQRAANAGRLRELVEWTSSLRPELVDALYKSDVEWVNARRHHTFRSDFNVTCNGSFFRPEVLSFIDKMRLHVPLPAAYTIIMPCAADKPYPAPLHKAVMDAVSAVVHRKRHVEYIVATGVLGLIPHMMWDEAPRYDSGIPNELRVREEAKRYFDKFAPHRTGRIIVYSDFYGPAIVGAARDAQLLHGIDWEWPIEDPVYDTLLLAREQHHAHVEYINLRDPSHLDALARCIRYTEDSR